MIVRAVKKYGKENFIRETIENCTLDNINEREDYWIEKLDARNPAIGYNILRGGLGNKTGYKESEETKLKKSKTHTGMTHSEITKLSISESHLEYWKNLDENTYNARLEQISKNRVYGKRKGTSTTDIGKKNMSDAQKKLGHRGTKNINSKYVWNFVSPNGEIYDNVYESSIFCETFKLTSPGILYAVKRSGIYKGWKVSRKLINPL